MATQSFRYSNGQIATREAAASFSWEAPVPVAPFWDSIDYCTARNFLANFSDAELLELPIDNTSTEDNDTKLHLLLSLLKDKIAREEAVATVGAATLSPGSSDGLYEQDYPKWHALHQALFALQDVLNLHAEAGDTIALLVAKSPKDNLSAQHMQANYLVKVGKFAEAEEKEREVLEWMENHPRLGRDSPQAINARRILVQALWGQGLERRKEAEEMLKELQGIVEGMEGGRFAIYREEEGRLNGELRRELGLL